MSGKNSSFVGKDKRDNDLDRRGHTCIHETDFGKITSDVGYLDRQLTTHVAEQKERNQKIFEQLNTLNTSVDKISSSQDTLPNRVVEILEKKKANKLSQYSGILRNVSIIIGILTAFGAAMFWMVNFVQHTSVPIP